MNLTKNTQNDTETAKRTFKSTNSKD